MTALPLEAADFLEMLNDYAVGGTSISPGLARYSHKEQVRTALETVEDWINSEGVHLNPGRESQQTALRSMGLLDSEEYYEDRVVSLDFDIYDKDGSLRGETSVTPEEILAHLKRENYPLPYYWLESGTPGNFHMVWVLKDPVEREAARPWVRAVYQHWGADPNFTNSTMRNPVYLSVHAPDKVRWWREWAEERPLLESVTDLLPTEWVSVGTPAPEMSRNSKVSSRENFKARMTVPQLEAAMARTGDGEGRWHLLCAWVRRHVRENLLATDSPLLTSQMHKMVARGNALFPTPMEKRRVDLIVQYWTAPRQRHYAARQRKAGKNNPHAQASRDKAREEFLELMGLRDTLTKFLRGDPHALSATQRELDSRFEGRRASTKGEICYSYLAWMHQVAPKEVVDRRTGEVREVSPANQVKNLIGNGRRAGYHKEKEESPQTSPPKKRHLVPSMIMSSKTTAFEHLTNPSTPERMSSSGQHPPRQP